ncbi:MAG: suppressor of fused domain protein [Firmicutes bacterium]|nr:suppressor of fused domain protein [Bacillota bacterium]MBR7147422.1 suppressor of fused domain protein [Bacillota bacterium]
MIAGGTAGGHEDVPTTATACSTCGSAGSGCDPSACATCGGGLDDALRALERKKDAAKANETQETIGWDAITATFEKYYPDQKTPLHFAPEVPWALGGPDPLDGISVYDAKEYYHFVTYGLSELYGKESDNLAYSGYGLEFTLKLAKEGLGETPMEVNRELRNIAGILQSLARMVFTQNKTFAPDEYIWSGQTTGIDANGTSNIVGFITRLDNAGIVETPHGWVKFTELIGVTEAELQGIKNDWITVPQLFQALGTEQTIYNRISMM